MSKVGKELAYQPFALAYAAFYVKQRRRSKIPPKFAWEDYLKNLDEGKRNFTEKKRNEINDTYSLTMYTAVLMAIRLIGESDPILKHALTFLSYVSHEPLPFHLVESYVLHVDQSADTANVRLRIRECFPILLSDEKRLLSISLHSVVHDVIKQYITVDAEEDGKSPLPGIVLQMLILPKIPILENTLIPHLKSFYIRTENFPTEMLIPKSGDLKQTIYKRLFYLAEMLEKYDESFLSRYYRALGFQVFSAID